MTTTKLLVSNLLKFVAKTSMVNENSCQPIFEDKWNPLPDYFEVERSTFAKHLVDKLDEALIEMDCRPHFNSSRIPLGTKFSLGSMIQRAPIRSVLRGFLEPVIRLPLVEQVPDRVAFYLIGIPGGRDFLKREQHNFGWHYHYLDAKKRRSDIILCWDTRWLPLPI